MNSENVEEAEHWRAVVGYEGHYEISDLGRVRSIDRAVRFRDGRIRTFPGRVTWQGVNAGGYPHVRLYRGNEGRTRTVHQLVAEAFLGPRPDGMETCHCDGDSTNNRPSNLRYDSRSENHRDAVRHGTHNETRKVVCRHGHALVAPNLRADALRRGWRKCLACERGRGHVRKNPTADRRAAADRYYADLVREEKVA